MVTKIAVEPTIEPVTIDDIKDHLRIDIDDEDIIVKNFIRAARRMCEKIQNMAYLTQTWDLFYDDWPSSPIEIPYPPLQSVSYIYYTDASDTVNELSTSYYDIDTYSKPGRVSLSYGYSWPGDALRAMNGFNVRYVAGYTDRKYVPEEVKVAIKLLVGHLYEHREETSSDYKASLQQIPLGIYALLGIDRIIPI